MKTTLNLNGILLDISKPSIMGILNVTPDSFYSQSRTQSVEEVLDRANKMITEGATFLDIGGYSTRPDAQDIPVQEELDRVLPVIETIHKHYPACFLSIDTFRAKVAQQAVQAGACMVNDISGGNIDPTIFETVADLGVPYVLMHSRGTPATMTQLADYKNLTLDIIDELQVKVHQLRLLGVKDIIIDPGLGFAKTREQNFQLLNQLEALQIFGVPLLAGVSRKSMIWKTLAIKPEDALNGTTVLNTIALMKGANILRVHDVKEAMECIQLSAPFIQSWS